MDLTLTRSDECIAGTRHGSKAAGLKKGKVVLNLCYIEFTSALANGTPTRATDNCFTCVCHVELNWKNFTPLNSTPSTYTENQTD
jgi:hypothetical protein